MRWLVAQGIVLLVSCNGASADDDASDAGASGLSDTGGTGGSSATGGSSGKAATSGTGGKVSMTSSATLDEFLSALCAAYGPCCTDADLSPDPTRCLTLYHSSLAEADISYQPEALGRLAIG